MFTALSYDGKLHALDARNGSVRSKFATDGERQSKARGIHDLQPKNKTIADPYDVFLSSPVVAQAAVYFGSGDGDLYAVDTTPGDLCWKFRTGDIIHASQAVADGVVYFGSWDGFSYAIDATTGKGKWRFDNAQSWIVASPAVSQEKVFFATSDSSLGDRSSVSRLARSFRTPLVVHGVVYFASTDENLYALE